MPSLLENASIRFYSPMAPGFFPSSLWLWIFGFLGWIIIKGVEALQHSFNLLL